MRKEIADIVREAARAGAAEMLRSLQPESDTISQRQAYVLYGEAFVRKNVEDGNLTVIRKGSAKNSKKFYSRAELIQLVAARNVLKSVISIDSNY